MRLRLPFPILAASMALILSIAYLASAETAVHQRTAAFEPYLTARDWNTVQTPVA